MTRQSLEQSFSLRERLAGRLVAISLATLSVMMLGALAYWAAQPAHGV